MITNYLQVPHEGTCSHCGRQGRMWTVVRPLKMTSGSDHLESCLNPLRRRIDAKGNFLGMTSERFPDPTNCPGCKADFDMSFGSRCVDEKNCTSHV